MGSESTVLHPRSGKHAPGEPWRLWAPASQGDQWEPGKMVHGCNLLVHRPPCENLCLSPGPRTPMLETLRRKEGGWLSPGEKDASGGTLNACLHFVVYLLVSH